MAHVNITSQRKESIMTNAVANNNTNNKGEKEVMANNNTNNTNNTNNKGEKEIMVNTTLINKDQLNKMEKDTLFMQDFFKGNVKTLSQIIGSLDAVKYMIVDTVKNAFVIKEENKARLIPFGKTKGQELISVIAEYLPRALSKEELDNNKAYKRLKDLNLLNYKGVNYVPPMTRKRDTAIVLSAVLQDTYVVINGEVVGLFATMAKDEDFGSLIFNDKMEVKENITFVSAKDLRLNHMNSVHSAYQKQAMNLAMHKVANYNGITKQVVDVKTKHFSGALTYTLEKPMSSYVFGKMCFIDGNITTSLDEAEENVLLAAMFDRVQFVHRENGILNGGERINPSEVLELRAYIRSMAQARTKGAVGFESLDSAANFLIATGQLDKAYAKEGKDGLYVLDVDKAYKRFFLGGSSGQIADKGILSANFIAQCKVETFQFGELHTFGEIKPAYVVFTHKVTGETFTIALIEDFTTTLTRGENGENDFLINVLDENNALLRLEEFKYWNVDEARKILEINATDGQAFHNGRIDAAARSAKALNRFSTFQFRFGIANKGNSLRCDMITDYLKADLVLTESTVKAGFDPETLANEIKENGFYLYIVGQRKDSEDGLFVASQATQTYNFTESELIQLHKDSIAFVKNAMDTRNAAELMEVLDVAKEAQEDEFATFDFLRIAKQLPAVLNEQYFKDDVASLIVKRMNQLLDSRVYAKKARPRYMFIEPMAIFNAMKRGSYTIIEEDKVLNHNEVIAPSLVGDKYELEVGEAAATRFPCSVVHESPVVTAVYNEEYARMAQEYAWGGLVFFDAKSWVVQRMAGADFDGDSCILIFDAPFVAALKRTQSKLFAGLRVLPCIDAYVVEGGVEFGTGCPTYVTEENKTKKAADVKEVNDFISVSGSKVIFDNNRLAGEKEEENRFELAKAVASVANVKTIHSIESSLIGIIANQIMILTDLLTQNVLTREEVLEVETDLLLLRSKGAWEIDRPKHGGAYLEMPIYQDQDNRLSPLRFKAKELGLTNEEKYARLADEKKALRHVFKPEYKMIDGKKVLTGFSMKKPSWLASQKAEFGLYNAESTFQKAYDFVSGTEKVEGALQVLCNELAIENKGQNNNILNLVRPQMKIDASVITAMENALMPVYSEYAARELDRSRRENMFKTGAHNEMKENGVYRGKDFDSITSARKNAKLRTVAEYVAELDQFKAEKEILKARLRKDVYEIAANNGWDVRYLVGTLYMLIKRNTSNSKEAYVPYRMDGREVRFVGAGSGNVSVCFEVFGEEMKSLLLDDVETTSFIPTNTDFVLVEDASFVEEATQNSVAHLPQHSVKVRVLAPNANLNGKTVQVNAVKPVSITEQNGKLVMNFLKDQNVTMKGWSPVVVATGNYNIFIESIKFESEGVATVTFRA